MRNEFVSREEEALVEQLATGTSDEVIDHLASSRALDADVQQPMGTVGDLLGYLSDVELEIVDKYFGLSGAEPLSADAIGDLTGLGARRTMEIIDGALRQLRQVETAGERERKVA